MLLLKTYSVTVKRRDINKEIYFDCYAESFIEADKKVSDIFTGCDTDIDIQEADDATYNMEEVQ